MLKWGGREKNGVSLGVVAQCVMHWTSSHCIMMVYVSFISQLCISIIHFCRISHCKLCLLQSAAIRQTQCNGLERFVWCKGVTQP